MVRTSKYRLIRNLTVFGMLAAGSTAVMAEERSLTILHTNDIHGRYAAFEVAPGNATSQTGDPGRDPEEFDRSGEIGGFSRLATKVRQVRERHDAENVLLVDAGDTFSDDLVGNETEGEAIITLMNAVGYNFMALGNHDFDYGLERTRELETFATFPMRAANILEDDQPVFGKPWQVFERAGMRIAVVGIGYHNTDQTSGASNIRGLFFTDGIAAVEDLLPEMQEASDIVVAISHQGTKADRLLASRVDGIDVIVGGHSHDRLQPPEKIEGTWIVQALADAAMLGELTLVVDEANRLRRVEGAVHLLWADEIEPDPEIASLVTDLAEPFADARDTILTESVDRIGRQYRSASPFDTLVGDILRDHTGADIAMMPGVGYGLSFGPGPVTRGALYTLLPHPAKLVTFEMRGEDIVAVLEQSATNQSPVDPQDTVGGLVQTSNLGWTVDLTRPVSARISDVTIEGRPIQMDEWYRVATNSGMANGLHRYDFSDIREKTVHEVSVTSVVEDELARRESITAPPTDHVKLIR
ncbi:5'-nucleotidase [Palleronia aestuarii]|uniref:5'-nucleotidase n=1 Tax=Palleronia aestuarii TaxID=568105 RepID=A0A2W7N357_9RHOB|nr:bifunctional UDP-sugar hydrolase/5'-nucleotidase [Palleronia aestuarii]PZX12787.1 5'-nucleotidase [Palleronia aestuarii]